MKTMKIMTILPLIQAAALATCLAGAQQAATEGVIPESNKWSGDLKQFADKQAAPDAANK